LESRLVDAHVRVAENTFQSVRPALEKAKEDTLPRTHRNYLVYLSFAPTRSLVPFVPFR
jgi:hypothetical protein